MRWNLDLPSRNLVAFAGSEALTPQSVEKTPSFSITAPDGREVLGAVRINQNEFEVAVLATRSSLDENIDFPEWYFKNHVVLYLNPDHDHASRRMYAVDASGQVHTENVWIVPGEETGEAISVKMGYPPAPTALHTEFRQLDSLRFFVRIVLKKETLRIQDGTPLGMQVKVGFASNPVLSSLCWPEQNEWSKDLPITFADVYLPTSTLVMDRIEIPKPTWGNKHGTLQLKGRLLQTSKRSGLATVETILPDDAEHSKQTIPWQADGNEFSLTLPVYFSHRAKWSNDVFKIAKLRLTLADESKQTLWTSEYPFGFDCGIIVREQYGPQGKPLPSRPKPTSKDFTDEYRQYILSRIPDYHYRTTRDSAPSDFYLQDPMGEEHLNLGAANSLDLWADQIVKKFPDWSDALCAIAAWVYHPLITRHSASWNGISGRVSVDSIPRLGGCFCSDTSPLCACLAEKVGARLGVKLEGYSMGMRGHLVSLISTPHGRVVIDGMIGLYFHSLDNQRLATLEEMRVDPQIALRSWYCPRTKTNEFFYGVNDQVIRKWENRALVWP